MKLTKDQITYIDDYLKHHKVKYWDIRIELLDHIVSTVEEKMEQGISFDDAMIEVHKSFGNKMTMFWNSGIEYGIFANGHGFKSLIENKRLEISKKYRKLLNKEIVSFFKSNKYLGLLLSLFLLELFISKQLDVSEFIKINLVLFLTPVVLFYIYSFRNHMMKKKSINMQYSISSMTISFFLFQGIIQFIKPEGIFNVSIQTQVITLAIIVPLNLAFTYCGFEVYRKAEKFYSDIFNKLQQL